MEKPLVSVCIPTYNNEDTIEETVSSVLRQTWKNLELVIVDDGSSDRRMNWSQNWPRRMSGYGCTAMKRILGWRETGTAASLSAGEIT